MLENARAVYATDKRGELDDPEDDDLGEEEAARTDVPLKLYCNRYEDEEEPFVKDMINYISSERDKLQTFGWEPVEPLPDTSYWTALAMEEALMTLSPIISAPLDKKECGGGHGYLTMRIIPCKVLPESQLEELGTNRKKGRPLATILSAPTMVGAAVISNHEMVRGNMHVSTLVLDMDFTSNTTSTVVPATICVQIRSLVAWSPLDAYYTTGV